MAKRKIHWYWGCGWGRAYSHDFSASQFLTDASKNPDWFCVTCATKARLALAKESAPKHADAVWPKPRPIGEGVGREQLADPYRHHPGTHRPGCGAVEVMR